jgi:FMN phosphatase YigB (HAD superfamily)
MYTGILPLLKQLPAPNAYLTNRTAALAAFQIHEHHLQTTQPTLLYRELLPKAYVAFAHSLSLPTPPAAEAEAFGASIGSWPAHPDTVAALQTLGKYYKLVMLSNIDNETIGRTKTGPLGEARFDAVHTAEMIGGYKPDLGNFRYLLEGVKREFGVEKGEVLHSEFCLGLKIVCVARQGMFGGFWRRWWREIGVGMLTCGTLAAQALYADMVPAKSMGMTGAWIDREKEDEEYEKLLKDDKVNLTWRFRTLGEMAEAVERAFEEEGK